MPTALDATVGSATANSFATLIEARAYFADHLYGAAALMADDDTLTQALLMATRLIDTNYAWFGFTSSTTQALTWPRYRMENPNQRSIWIDSGAIPQRLKEATAELARLLMVTDRTADNDVQVQGIASIAVTGATITFTGQGRRRVFPASVSDMLVAWGYLRTAGGTLRLIRS